METIKKDKYRNIIAFIAIVGVVSQIFSILCYHFDPSEEHNSVYLYLFYVCNSFNMILNGFVLIISIILQQWDLKAVTSNQDVDTLQSFRTNLMLIFLTSLYCGTISILGFIHYSSYLYTAIYHLSLLIGMLLIGAHFIGSLKWGKISYNDLDISSSCSSSWWCCIYLIFAFLGFIYLTVVTPWFSLDSFVQLNDDLQDTSGEFVHVLIIYGCRPALTIVAFRCIEQILHQISTNEHSQLLNHQQNRLIALQYNVNNSSELTQQFIINDHDNNELQNKNKIIFHPITAVEILLLAPFFVCVIIYDLMTLNSDTQYDEYKKYNSIIYCIIYLTQIIWSIYVIKVFRSYSINKLHLRHILNHHLALFISGCGLIIAVIGYLGRYSHIWQVYFESIFEIFYILSQCVVLVIINEIKLPKNIFNETLSWKTKSFGKVLITIHLLLIIHSFLNEGYHLEHILDSAAADDLHNDDPKDVFSTIEFIFFFWGIEFHLACIERIEIADKENNQPTSHDVVSGFSSL